MIGLGRILRWGLVVSALASSAAAQAIQLTKLGADVPAPVIDGVLDDSAWEVATPLGDLTQVTPMAGAVPSERTELRLTYDSTHVFLYLRCFDSDPSGVRATLSKRDANLNPDDRVEFLFDTFFDRRNAFWFQIGAGGSKGDALISRNGTRFDKRWDTLWEGKARVTDEGWQAEVAIPVASINFDPEATSWGFNARRLIRRRSEEARWASPENRTRFFEVSRSGVLHGIGGMHQGLGLDVKPFTVASLARVNDKWESDADVGLDAFYRISPATKLSLTVNTDFAEVEVDDRQVNLTRFPLFFPEKRDFFLEDSGSFHFGNGGDSSSVAEPFFSRRIGLDGSGNEIPLDVALKLTRRTDKSSLGLLGAKTGSTDTSDEQELFVGRYSYNLGEESDAGVIWTHGDPRGLGRDDTYGVDFNWRTTTFRGAENLRFSAFALRTDAEGADGQDAWFADLSYPNDEFNWDLSASGVDADFDPALGFVRRTGVRTYAGSFAYQPRLYSTIRRLRFVVSPEVVLGSDNDLQSAEFLVRPIDIEWESGEELELQVQHRREVLDAGFDISDGVNIGSGGYSFTRYSLEFETSGKRAFSGAFEYEGGNFFDGSRDDIRVEGLWRPSALGSLSLEYERNDVRLPSGYFRVHVARMRADLQFGPELSWSNSVQWDNESNGVGLNSRLWWIPKPGTEFFLVVNQGWDWDTSDFIPRDTQIALKIGTTWRF